MIAERPTDVNVRVRKVWLECPEHLGVATHMATFGASSDCRLPQSERCDLEDAGANCRRSCLLGITGKSPLTRGQE